MHTHTHTTSHAQRKKERAIEIEMDTDPKKNQHACVRACTYTNPHTQSINFPVLRDTINETRNDQVKMEGLLLLETLRSMSESTTTLSRQFDQVDETPLKEEVLKHLDSNVRHVEVLWNGQLQRYYFPVHPICANISDGNIDRIVEDVDRTSQVGRLQKLKLWPN